MDINLPRYWTSAKTLVHNHILKVTLILVCFDSIQTNKAWSCMKCSWPTASNSARPSVPSWVVKYDQPRQAFHSQWMDRETGKGPDTNGTTKVMIFSLWIPSWRRNVVLRTSRLKPGAVKMVSMVPGLISGCRCVFLSSLSKEINQKNRENNGFC